MGTAKRLAGDHERAIQDGTFAEQKVKRAEEYDESQTAERGDVQEDLLENKRNKEGLEKDEPRGPFALSPSRV